MASFIGLDASNSNVTFWDDIQDTYDNACSQDISKLLIIGDFNAGSGTRHMANY